MQEHKYKAVQQPNQSYKVERDGVLLRCPKALLSTPVHTSDALGRQTMSMTIQGFNCSTECPFAELKEKEILVPGTAIEKETKTVYEITCEGGCKDIVVSEVVPYEEKRRAD